MNRANMGIGLYVVRLITEELGGTISVRDREDRRGPLFTIDLPVFSPASAEMAEERERARQAG